MSVPTLSEKLDTSKWNIGELQSGLKNGQKFANLNSQGSFLVSENPLHCPFGASSWLDEKKNRLNVDLEITEPHVLEALRKIDSWASKLPVKGTYNTLVKENEKFKTTKLRTKMLTMGQYQTRFWDDDRNPLIDPDLKNASVQAVVAFTRLWQTSNMYGIICELRHAVVTQKAYSCPI